MTPFARALIAARADRMLWGTNWPHPLPQQGVPITQISPYQNVDNILLVTRLAEWCPDAATRKMILVDTPERLYRFPRAQTRRERNGAEAAGRARAPRARANEEAQSVVNALAQP